MTRVVALILFLVASVHGHGWLNTPQPRGYQGDSTSSASQSAPCGLSGTFPTITTVQNNEVLSTQYQIGGGHSGSNPDFCAFALSTSQTDTNQFQSNVIATGINCPVGEDSYNLTLSSPFVNQTVYLQFHWAAGDGTNWYACAQLSVVGAGVSINDLTANVPATAPVTPDTITYWDLDVPQNFFVYSWVQAPTGSDYITASISRQGLPTLSNYDETGSSQASSPIVLSDCSSVNHASTIYWAIYAGTSGNASYALTAQTYDAEVLYADSYPQITDSIGFGGSKWYYTEAYDTYGSPKIAVVTLTSGSGSVSLYKSQDCTYEDPNGSMSTGSTVACLDLGSQEGVKYFQVVVDGTGSFQYTFGVEEGTCGNVEDNPGVKATVSLFALISGLALALVA